MYRTRLFVGRYPIYQDEERHFMHIVHMNLRTLYQFFNLVQKNMNFPLENSNFSYSDHWEFVDTRKDNLTARITNRKKVCAILYFFRAKHHL